MREKKRKERKILFTTLVLMGEEPQLGLHIVSPVSTEVSGE